MVFLGGPSTGKTTLCETLTKLLNTITVAEYGREYWLEHQINRRLTAEQLLHIAQTQNRREDEATSLANDYLLCDTNAFTTWHFALHYHGTTLPLLSQLAHDCWSRYNLVVLCEDDIPYNDTWERSGDANHHEFQVFIGDYLTKYNIENITVEGTVGKRVETVLQNLEKIKLNSPQNCTSNFIQPESLNLN